MTMKSDDLTRIIADAVGGDRCIHGAADLSDLLAPPYREYSHGISLCMKLDDMIIDGIGGGPTAEYWRLYTDVNLRLGEIAEAVAASLNGLGIRAVPVKPTFSDGELDESYRKTLRTDFSHKLVATRAGLGWIGKTALLVTAAFGPRVRLASVLSAVPIECGAPVERSGCGSCDICVRKCPAQAANGMQWDPSIDRDMFFNAHRCREKCRELANARLGIDASICGICVSVCPVGSERDPGRRRRKDPDA